MTIKTLSPAEGQLLPFPRLDLDGVVYELRFTAGAGLRLMRRGIDPGRLKEIGDEWKAAGRATEFLFELLAAMLGKDERRGDGSTIWRSLGLTAEELLDQISIIDMGQIGLAITAAIKSRPAASAAETTPAPEPPQVQ